MELRTLDCWIFRQPYDFVSTVDIPVTAYVQDLKELIKDKTVMFRGVDAAHLDLYCIPSPDDEHLQAELEQWTAINQQCLNPQTKLSVCLSAEQQWLIVVVHPPIAVPMSLTCWVQGEGILSFPVSLSSNDTVEDLQRAVKAERPDILDDIPAAIIKLYLVPDLALDALEAAAERIRSQGPLLAVSKVSDIFPRPLWGRIHVMVVCPSPGEPVSQPRSWHNSIEAGRMTSGRVEEERDGLAAYIQTFKDTIAFGRSLDPAMAANPSNYAKIQASPYHILDGRFTADPLPVNTIAPPIQLFNPAFAFFSSKAFDPAYIPPVDFVRNIHRLIIEFTPTSDNDTFHQCRIRDALSGAIGWDLIPKVNPDDRTAPDHIVVRRVHNKLPCYLVILEEMDEFSTGASDQARCSCLHLIFQKESEVSRLISGCPTFIISSGGPWLSIMGGIVPAHCIVQQLTDFIWIPYHATHDDDQCLRVARVLYALRQSIERLDSWYQNLNIQDMIHRGHSTDYHPGFWPSPTAYKEQATNALVKFTYQRPLSHDSTCVTYLAKTDKEDVVVKFVTSYGADAHAHMASEGFAPRLLYHGEINVSPEMPSYGKLRMVVMEYLEGQTLQDSWDRRALPSSFKSDLERAMKHLHDGGYVFGNLRMPNVMVLPEGTSKSTAQLIDFDWAGKQGEVRYPFTINLNKIEWPRGVEGGALIEKEHDEVMLRLLTPGLD